MRSELASHGQKVVSDFDAYSQANERTRGVKASSC